MMNHLMKRITNYFFSVSVGAAGGAGAVGGATEIATGTSAMLGFIASPSGKFELAKSLASGEGVP